jgi:hypothetical protein
VDQYLRVKAYSGIGSRESPLDILEKMERLSHSFQDEWVLRSGGAPGADSAFEKGITNGNKEIYLPWRQFNDNPSPLFSVSKEAQEMASKFHPNWNNLSPAVKKLMGRNAYQVLGYDLNSPAAFVLCWTPDGCESTKTRTSHTGGTGLAISLASSLFIPVINMFNKNWQDKLMLAIEESE